MDITFESKTYAECADFLKLLFEGNEYALDEFSTAKENRVSATVKSVMNTRYGTPEGTRTPNPRNRNPMLYPLSHRRISESLTIIAGFPPFVKRSL